MKRYIAKACPITILICLLCLLVMQGCTAPGEVKEHTRNLLALNTWINIRIYAGREGPEIINSAVQRLEEIENRMSVTIQDSDVSRINSNAGIQPVKVHEDTFEVIERRWSMPASNGAFDITIYPIVQLWELPDHPRVPPMKRLKKVEISGLPESCIE